MGVAMTMPSQPHVDRGRPSISTVSSSIRSREAFSTVTSLRAHEENTVWPSSSARTSRVVRSSTV